jgi:lysyl-tRNA synthetase class 1
MSSIIGKGTWYDKAAYELLERERKLGRKLDLIRTESGLGASGFPHIGSLGDALRNLAIAMAVQVQGYNSELIAFSDDKDGLRKVPAGLPEELEKWVGYPVSSIPDPFGDCHGSYGSHMTSLLLDALDTAGAKYRFMSGTKVYADGVLNQEIIDILENADSIGAIIHEEIGQEKYQEVLPYFPICEGCGRIYTTHAYAYLPNEKKILYRCEGMELRGKWLDGCGYEGEIDVRSGKGKLSWKVEFAARWKALDIRFEAYGKDISDSVRVNDRICREILNWEPPMHVQYEMFLDRGGKKISKSAGNVFTPQVWYQYGSPQSLNLLIFKRFVGTKSGSVEDIPMHMDEMDDLEAAYTGKKKIRDSMEAAKQKGLYEYCWMFTPPEHQSVHLPYNLMVKLARVAPHGNEREFITEKLEEYGYLKENKYGLENRINFALNWVKDYEDEPTHEIKISSEEKKAIKTLLNFLNEAETVEEYQSSVFNVAQQLNIKPRKLFKTLYQVLLGRSQGPRFGPYVDLVGKETILEELRKIL